MEQKPKVGLIIPPSVFLADERVFPALGLLKVAAVLEQAKREVIVIDLSGIANYTECIEKILAEYNFLFLGATATSPQMVAINKIIKTIRAIAPQIPVVIGGPHISASVASEKLDREGKGSGRGIKQMQELKQIADILVAGDGEIAIFQVLNAIENGAAFPLVIDADNPDSEMFLTEEVLNNLPFPARHLIDLKSYHYFIEKRSATSLISELGCVYPCHFCGMRNSPSFRRIRVRRPETVRDELLFLYREYGYTAHMFMDDELNISTTFPSLMKEIVRAQEILNQDFRLRGFVKSNLFTEEQAKLMYDAGFRNLLVGFESGSDRVLTNINKRATKAQNTRCMEIASKYGLKIKALMSIGHPAESEQTIRETRDWLMEVRPHDLDITLITIYNSTPYSDFSKPHKSIPGAWTFTVPKTGDKLHFYETDFLVDNSYYKGIPGQYRSFVFSDYLSCDELVVMRDQLEKEIREKLDIPFYSVASASRVETSMGQGFPIRILRASKPDKRDEVNTDALVV